VKEEKEGGREAAAGEPFAAKTGAARGRSRTRRDRLLPLLPLPHLQRAAAYLLFFLAVPAVPPLFTDALHFGQWPPR
jgi:hypothetical protein